MHSLNQIYRTIWSEALNTWVAVSELVKSKGKRSGSSLLRTLNIASVNDATDDIHRHRFKFALLAASCLLTFQVQANPTGGNVVNGSASFNTSGNTLTVTNTPGAIIHWQDFSIQQNEITRFAQQSASSAVLNRVVGGNTSQILGALQSNGRVFLVNPNGVVFGAGATVDVAGLVATSLNLSDTDFLAGRHRFTSDPNAQAVSNAGNLNAQQGGEIWLIAPNVENSGVITAPDGEILLAAGSSVELVNSLDPNLRVNITAPAGDATNVGQLVASAGRLGLFGTVVRNSGNVSADSATLQGGKIVFRSSQRTELTGTARAQGVSGGEIKVLSDMQTGTVQVGGTLDASAPVSGDGGFIDTFSAHVQAADTAHITTAAANGNSGTWLIDPKDFTIAATGGDMTGAAIATALDTTSVIIQSVNGATEGNGDIFVNDSITKTVTGATTTLTLQAESSIIVASSIAISSTGGALNVVFNADSDGLNGGVISMASGSSITSNGGNITLGGGIAGNGTGNAVGNATYASGIDILGASINSGAGNITLNGQGYGVGGSNMGVYLHTGASLTTTTGNVTINGTGGGMTDMTAGSNRGVRISSASAITTGTGNIGITGQGGWDGDGVQVVGGSQVKSTSGGQITLSGTTGLGTGLDYGIYLTDGGTLVETGGNILFTGVSNSVAGADNKGIALYEVTTPLTTGPKISALGTGNITFNGTGGGGTTFSSGMTISGSEVTAADGTITLNGASGAATGTENRGVNLHNGAWVHATGLGSINMTGVAVNTATASFGSGVRVASGAIVQTASGAINITGSGTNGTGSNYGVLITDALSAVKSASGAVSITGSGWGTGIGNYGVYVDAGGTVGTNSTAKLLANRDIYINSALTNSTGGSLVLNADMNGTGVGTVTFGASGSIALSGGGRADLYYNPVSYSDAATKSDALTNPYTTKITGLYTAWMLVNDVGLETGGTLGLQAMSTNLAGNYALGTNINAAGTTIWNFNGTTYDGFAPIGNISTPFTGRFDGLGHTVDSLTINRPTTDYVGLFGRTQASTIKNVSLTNVNISGNSYVGSLVGWHQGTLAFSSN
ncbi:MAG: filamentous hemagglutinin N-terminal domain-containing protein, partial [Sideroxyarcus sp.]|nr:filamentous hemagglutinin N-terminal domain-containing protein [Sideroxyarcus sp.]